MRHTVDQRAAGRIVRRAESEGTGQQGPVEVCETTATRNWSPAMQENDVCLLQLNREAWSLPEGVFVGQDLSASRIF